jgi:hypothetical protein
MECFGTTDFDNNSQLITLSETVISDLHCTINCIWSHLNGQFFFFFQALNFLVESFGLLNDLFSLPSILDAGYPVFDLPLLDNSSSRR